MRGLDTNVLVRYLTQDDRAQARRANAFIDGIVAEGRRCHVNVIVLCEVVWVLRGAYGFDKVTIIRALDRILESAQFSIEDRDLVRRALEEFRRGRGDFADYVIGIWNRQAGCEDTVTFDHSLKKSEFFALL